MFAVVDLPRALYLMVVAVVWPMCSSFLKFFLFWDDFFSPTANLAACNYGDANVYSSDAQIWVKYTL